MSKTTSTYTFTGNGAATIYSLIAAPSEGSSDLSTLSVNNYPSGGTQPNKANQNVFMNQSVSWWVSQLNAKTIKYTPVSNDVNWSYTNSSGSALHIDRDVTNIIIPNKNQSVQRNDSSNGSTIVFEPKHGVGRTDTIIF